MTVNNQTVEVTYVGDGVQTDFPVTFEILDPLQVRWTPYEGNVVETSPGNDEWVVRFNTAPTGDIRIYRDTPITQEADFLPFDAFPPDVLNASLDKLTLICQELEAEKVSTPDGDTRYLKLTGGVMSGDIAMSDRHITSLSDPVNDQDAVNKRWYKANQIPGIQGEVGPVGPPPAVTADANTVPWEEGADVTVTPDSDPYTGVHMDFQIPEGPVGVTPDFSADVETLEPEEEATVTVTQTGPPDAHAVNLSFAIPQGERGLKGEGIDFKGNLPTATDLPETGETDGDAYFIEDEQALYVWGGETQKWENLGDIRGPQGDAGKGWKSGVYNSADGKVTFTGQDWSPELTFTTDSLIGEQGPPGNDGSNGQDGADAHNPVVGSVTTETKPDGTDAEVDVTANGEGNFDFDFKIPRGHSPAVNTVSTTTGAAGSEADVSVTSTPDFDLDFGFTIPRGDQGIQGIPGISHYDFGRFGNKTTTGFSTLSSLPVVVDNTTMYRATVYETFKVGTIEIRLTNDAVLSFLLSLQDFELGHTLIVTLINDGPNEVLLDFTASSSTIPEAPRYAPGGELPSCASGVTQLWALTNTQRGLFINMTEGFEAL